MECAPGGGRIAVDEVHGISGSDDLSHSNPSISRTTILSWSFLLLLSPLVASDEGFALDTLVVSSDSRDGDWVINRESSRFVGVAQDSIWMWDVQPNADLVETMQERNGKVKIGPVVEGAAMVDGELTTFYDPDVAGITRTTPIIVDLGGAFSINRVRFHPRLDSRNQRRFLQEFSVSTQDQSALISFTELFSFFAALPNRQPVVDKRLRESRIARYLKIAPSTERPWEIAEIEIYGDGTLPRGEYVSKPLRIRWSNGVLGLVRFEGGSIAEAPAIVHTRTGPDDEPEHYFVLSTQVEGEIVKTSRGAYFSAPPDSQAFVRRNPEWSTFEPISAGVVRSPSERRYMQFRVQMFRPGTQLERIVFEVVSPPLVQSLVAEISPEVVEPGVETRFMLSMVAHMERKGFRSGTGFDRVQIRSSAEIAAIERVLVDDRRVGFRRTFEEDGSVTVQLLSRVEQDGSFIQVRFRSTIFRDQTSFQVRVVDERDEDETGYQIATEGDADTETASDGLVVKLTQEEGHLPLLTKPEFETRVLTPNADGVNDELRLTYSLLTLTEPAQVSLQIYDLSGRLVAVAFEATQSAGNYEGGWDGRGVDGELLPPGSYIYQLRVKSDDGVEAHRGVVGVAY